VGPSRGVFSPIRQTHLRRSLFFPQGHFSRAGALFPAKPVFLRPAFVFHFPAVMLRYFPLLSPRPFRLHLVIFFSAGGVVFRHLQPLERDELQRREGGC
jgi:hypothetical protein